MDVSTAVQVGRTRARQGVPLAEVMSAYRVGVRHWWERFAHDVQDVALSKPALLVAASEVWHNQSRYVDAMTAGYREVSN